MDGLTLLAEARAAGLSVEAQGARMVIRGPKRAEPVARRLIEHKLEVMFALRVAAFQRRLREWLSAGRPGVPLLALPGVEPRDGECCSCAEPLEPGRAWRCALCREAVRVVLGMSETSAGGRA